MLEVPRIFEDLNSRSKWLALWVISRKKGLSGRKVAEEAGLSWAPAKAALDYLAEKHFVLVQERGRQKAYFPNEDHFLFPALRVFFRLLEQVADDLFKELKDFLAPEHTLLAGKMGRHVLYLVFKGKLPPEEKIRSFLALKP